MALDSGTTIGSYQVTAKIGEGGMGQVYQARDTKLDRDVALKVLPQAFAEDPDRLARFAREAKVLASLNHPNIAAIYGVEEADDTRALVLELVEGPTLADWISRGRIPVKEALPIARQIAEALDAAHEAGVIHRDLKPANIKVRDDVTVKVLDFGLAKAFDAPPNGDPSQSPTLTHSATQIGVIMGTAAYVSPEQARGRPVDKRADIWAFGCVLYEMLAGRRAFEGNTAAEVPAEIMKSDPAWANLPTDLSPAVSSVIRRCLEKDPRKRLRDIGDVWPALAEPFGTTGAADAGWRWKALALVAGTAVVIAVLGGLPEWVFPRAVNLPTSRLALVAPPGVQPLLPVLSPDGQWVAFGGMVGSRSQIYVRRMDQLDSVPLVATTQTAPESFSPDSEWLVFTEWTFPRMLKRVPLGGGPVVPVAEWPASHAGGAVWLDNDTLILGSSEGLWSMPLSGKDPRQLTALAEGEIGHVDPRVLPGGANVLFTVLGGKPSGSEVAALDLHSLERHTLVPGRSPQFLSTGHLVFWRDNSLWAAPFDEKHLQVTGDPLPVIENVLFENIVGVAHYDVSTANDTLAYVSADAQASVVADLIWVDRNGAEEPVGAEPRDYVYARLSPDGRLIATKISGDIFIYDLGRRTLTPFTFDPANETQPVWMPDGSKIAFSSWRGGGVPNAFLKAVDGTGSAERLTASATGRSPFAFSHDGKNLLVVGRRADTDTGVDIGMLSVGGESSIEWLLEEPYNETWVEMSPDGKWIAYVSDESGVPEVYVRPFPNVHDGRWQISTGGGIEPVWGRDSRELFYRTRGDTDGTIAIVMTVNGVDPTFEPGIPTRLFEGMYRQRFPNFRTWDISSDGERFLMIKDEEPLSDRLSGGQVIVVQNWGEELKRLVPTE